jgi:hypothetical protein
MHRGIEKALATTLYKNNSGLIAKTKVKYINQTIVKNRKVSA